MKKTSPPDPASFVLNLKIEASTAATTTHCSGGLGSTGVVLIGKRSRWSAGFRRPRKREEREGALRLSNPAWQIKFKTTKKSDTMLYHDVLETCQICICDMTRADQLFPLHCPTKLCSFNVCLECIISMLLSEADG